MNFSQQTSSARLAIVGGGSTAFGAALKASELGAHVTLINDGLPIGGTCVNVGCVPSKTLIRAAEAHHRAAHPRFHGIESGSKLTDFKAVIEQKRELVEELRQAKYVDVVADLPNVRRIDGRARLVSAGQKHHLNVNGETIRADRVLIATGARALIPPIPGLEESRYLTNATAFELEVLPESLLVLGGGYVGVELAQMFSRFGSKVTILQRSGRILNRETADVSEALTRFLSDEGMEVVTNVNATQVSRAGGTVVVEASVDGTERAFEGSELLVATGRKPNTTDTGLEDVGVLLNDRGFVVVDDALQTSVEGIYAAGDVLGENMFVYTAAYEGALAAENALSETPKFRDYTALPWVVFTDPQVAGVGLDEEQAAQAGIDVDVSLLKLSHVPRALAARDTRGFIKLIRDRSTDRVVGARIVAPEGSELLMELSLAIKYGITVTELATSFHPYLTLGEAVKLAAISFGKDVEKLSCCAA